MPWSAEHGVRGDQKQGGWVGRVIPGVCCSRSGKKAPRPSPEPFGFSCSRNKPSGAGGLGWAEVMAWAPCSSAEPPQPSGKPCTLQCWASPGERSTTPPPQPQWSFLPGLLPPVSGLSSKTSMKYPISSCPVSFSCAQIRL